MQRSHRASDSLFKTMRTSRSMRPMKTFFSIAITRNRNCASRAHIVFRFVSVVSIDAIDAIRACDRRRRARMRADPQRRRSERDAAKARICAAADAGPTPRRQCRRNADAVAHRGRVGSMTPDGDERSGRGVVSAGAESSTVRFRKPQKRHRPHRCGRCAFRERHVRGRPEIRARCSSA